MAKKKDKTNWDKIEDEIKAMKPLTDRMDESKDFVYMKPFKLRDFANTHDLDNVINVTGNSPAVFANAIVSDLIAAKWQTVVEGNITPRQAHFIEMFVEDNFAQADETLYDKYGITSLYAWLCNHVCVRSLIGFRWLSLIDGDQYNVECLPVDMRWTPYVRNNWVAPIYWRSPADLEAELEEFEKFAKEIEGGEYYDCEFTGSNDMEVREYWTPEVNELWIKKKKVFSQPNTLGMLPFVIVRPASGFMLKDKDYLGHDSEDLFFLNRYLYKEMNRALSVEQSLGMDVLFPPTEQEQDEFGSHPAQKPPKAGEVLAVRKGEMHKPVPRGDLNRASLTARTDIYKQIELGGISDAELGSASLDRAGIWFAKQFEIRHKLERSRFEALAIAKAGAARMMIKQFLMSSDTDQELLVGRTGRKNKYSKEMLGDPDKYRISFKSMASSKEMEIVNIAQAQAAKGTMPMKRIVTDIYQAEDPAGWLAELDLEKAKENNPAIALAEMAIRYAEEAEDMNDEIEADLKKTQSQILVHDYVMIMRQRMQPLPVEQASQKRTAEAKGANLQGLAAMPGLLGGNLQKNPVQEAATQ